MTEKEIEAITEATITAEYGDKWPKCKYCMKKAMYYHARHDTAKLENLCEEHYKKWHGERNEKI